MATGVISWSQTAATNATADSTINWAEGQAPSTVNDSARALMASVAKYRDDLAGVTTGGTSTAYTVTSNQGFGSLSAMNAQLIAFIPHTTNAATVTLNVDSLGAKALRAAPSTELAAGILVQGVPYLAYYNNSDSAFYLHGRFGTPYLESAIASGSAVTISSGVAITITSITLTAGDWDVSGNLTFVPGGSVSFSQIIGGTGTATNSLSGIPAAGSVQLTASFTVNQTQQVAFGPARFSVGSSTPIYLIADATYSGASATAYGVIRARKF